MTDTDSHIDDASPARSEDYGQVFNELVFRTLEPLSLGIAVLYALFVVMGFLDDHTGPVRRVVVSTDAASSVLFVGLYVACRKGLLRARWINPMSLAIACIGTGNVLLAFELVQDPFYLTYLPMIIVSYGALLLSLRWLLINTGVILGGTLLVVGNDLPVELLARYFPALVGATVLAIVILIVRRRGVIAAQRALAAARGELKSRLDVEERLAHSQRLDSLGKLVSGIAHEFNNLLMVINGYADQLVLDAKPDAPEAKDLRAIRDAGERAAALSSKLLAFSRQQVMKSRVVAVNDIVTNARPLLERSISGEIELHIGLAPDAGFVSVDTLQMEQVLLNLALNARDAMQASGGTLSITTAADPNGEGVRILVSDTGEGMRPDTRERAFEPFFTTKPHGSGTGLGLATVYGIVTQSGGTIDIDSAPGNGATFRIDLPRVEAPVAALQDSPSAGQPTQTLTGTVLVVDDEPDVRGVVTSTLEHHGFPVVAADSAASALELAATHPFDVLLTDIVMPAMSGTELVNELRRLGYTQPVVYMSGHGAGAEAQAAAHGPLLRKPFGAEALVSTVSGLLAQVGR